LALRGMAEKTHSALLYIYLQQPNLILTVLIEGISVIPVINLEDL